MNPDERNPNDRRVLFLDGLRVLFLDFEGVLISSQRTGLRPECPRCHGLCNFDPVAIARLNTVLERTGAKIVVSAAARVGRKLVELRELLHGHGVTPRTVIGATPPPFWRTAGNLPGGREIRSTRGEEIQAWLGGTRPRPRAFAILDDQDDLAPFVYCQVKTSWQTGLLDEHVEQLCAMLTGGSPLTPR